MSQATFYERSGASLARWVLRRPRTVTAVSLLFVALFAAGLARARFSTDYRIFFSKEDPALGAFERLEKLFTQTDNVLFVVKAREGSIFQPDGLEALQRLTDEGWRLPFAARVDSLTNFQRAQAEGSDISVAELLPRPARQLGAAELEAARRAAEEEPILRGSLLSKDGKTGAVNVTLRLPKEDPLAVTQTASAAREVARRLEAAYPSLEIRASGMAFVNDAFMQTSVQDLGLMLPLMCAAMLLVMGLILRSAVATGAVALIIWSSAALSMAIAGWLGYPLSPTSVAAPMIVLTVAVADGVHLVLSMMEHLRAGRARAEAIVASLEENLEAITYTWLTTVVGFVCLNYSDSPPVNHLANMTCFGVTLAFVLSFTLLPALLFLLPIRVPPARAAARRPLMERFSELVMRHRKGVLVGSLLLTAVGAGLASRLEANDEFIHYFSEDVPFRKDVDFTLKNLSGIYRLELLVDGGGPNGISEPTYLSALERFTDWLREQPEVEHVLSLTDILKRVNQVMGSGEAADYRLPTTRAAASEALLLYELGLPAGLGLTDRVSLDKSSARLTITVKDLATRDLSAFAKRAEGWLRANAPQSMWAQATGPVVIFSGLSDRNAKSMAQADFLSLVLIALCMILVLRSVKLGLLSVIPNLVPIILGYGLWYLFVGQMNIVATMAASISLGIIVDDTIHFFAKFRAMQRKKGFSPDAAMKDTLSHVGPAMLSTGTILSIGFAVLTLSSFQMTSHLGWLSLLIVSIAPLADLLLAPSLVLLLTPRPKPAPQPRTHSVEVPAIAGR